MLVHWHRPHGPQQPLSSQQAPLKPSTNAPPQEAHQRTSAFNQIIQNIFCALNGIIWCMWIWSHFAVTQQSYCNYARDVYHKMREMTVALMYAIVALSLWLSLFKYATDHGAMICTSCLAQGTALMTDLYVSLNMLYGLIFYTQLNLREDVFVLCSLLELFPSHSELECISSRETANGHNQLSSVQS